MNVPFVHRVATLAVGLCVASGCTESAGAADAPGANAEERAVSQALTRAPAPEAVVWTRRAPESDANPDKRMFHGLAYDPKAKRTVLFGGTTTGDVDGVLNDTWTWDGTT